MHSIRLLNGLLPYWVCSSKQRRVHLGEGAHLPSTTIHSDRLHCVTFLVLHGGAHVVARQPRALLHFESRAHLKD